MEEVQLTLNENNRGAFRILDEGREAGRLEIGISGNKLTAYHTEVSPEAEGRGLAKKMLAALVAYAREHALQVDPVCPFVNAQFKRHPADYADLWQQPAN